MSYQRDLLPALKDWGLNVIEVNGWQTRGSATFNPGGSVNHHTAGSTNGHIPSLNILVNGRSGLPGPLCNVGQSRSSNYTGSKLDDVYLIAAGRANHAGRGGWRNLVGNSSVFGLEIEHCGYLDREGFSERRQETAYRVHAAMAQVGGYSHEYVCQHKEWAPSRKIDFVGANGNNFRYAVLLTQLSKLSPEEFEEMVSIDVVKLINDTYEEAWGAGKTGDVKGVTNWAAHAGFTNNADEFRGAMNNLRKALGLPAL